MAKPYHEAGHAVLAERLGFPVTWVTLDRGDGAGAVVIAWPPWLTDESVRGVTAQELRTVERAMEVYLAGQLAERIHTGLVVPDSQDDAEECYRMAVQFFGATAAEAASLIRRLVRRARAALQKEGNPAAVYAIALNLRERGALSGEQVRELIRVVDEAWPKTSG